MDKVLLGTLMLLLATLAVFILLVFFAAIFQSP
jgi:hypothetical protein